jgi:hypothetical protein
MSTPAPSHISRRTIFVNPKLQGGAALCFSLAVLGGGLLFGLSFFRWAGSAIRIASFQGHYNFMSAYPVLGEALARHVAALSAGVLATSLLILLIMVRMVRRGAGRLVETFRISAEGDLSTPSGVEGLPNLAGLGNKVDAARGRTLARIQELREEADFLRREPVSDEEFARRWKELKDAIGKVAP